ncbi:MAG TPA: DNA-binding domain-containing protein [Bdellovibrio sp.]|nr:DNA-binding domain-containing protein [Bdellovibrio sp.]
MKLNEVQSMFKKSVLAVEAEAEHTWMQQFKPAGQLSLKEAFEVYHNGYLVRLTEALGETFEAVHWVLGDHLFQDVCHRYIESQPSVSYNLSDYGFSFPDFLKADASTRGILFLYDLARFEWLFKEIYHAPTPDPLPVERIQELLHSEDFKVSFIEAMNLFESPYAVYDIWNNRKEASYQFEDINWEHPENLLIYKKEAKIFVRRIDAVELHVLEELQDGTPVTAALADYSSLLTPDKIAQLFQMMMKAGIIDDIAVV